MEPTQRLPSEIDQLLRRGGAVLTGNQRAAHTLRLQFDRERHAEGRGHWQPPAIFAWETWLANLWLDMLVEGRPVSDRLPLNRTQELQLWRSVISADSDSDSDSDSEGRWSSLQSIAALAAMAADAWQQLCAYRGQQRLSALGVSGDTRTFQRWAQAFTRLCRSGLYLSTSELEAAVAHSVAAVFKAAAFNPARSEMLLVGFDTLTPAQSHLIDTLREAGVSIAQQAPAPIATDIHLAPAADLDDELAQAALWLRERIEAAPASHIAVIHPDIASERAGIDRVFRQVLAPELEDITADPASSPYEFSLGEPLSQMPMVAVALKLLGWTVAPRSIDEIGQLLLSPYFASRPPEREHRAEFDAFELRQTKLLRPELELDRFARLVAGSRRADNLAGLNRQLSNLQSAVARLLSEARQKPFAEWADHIRELLQAAAWASAAPDDSIEFQTRRKWESALDELATLDFEGTRVGFPQALACLEQIAQRTLFAPESRQPPVQIVGPREAAGQSFDAIWFLRASDLTWPVRPRMNPLLGWRLQRALRMPGSDPDQDAEDGRRITARIAASAPVVVFSYAVETADERQRPSSAIAALPLTPLPASQALAPLSFETAGLVPRPLDSWSSRSQNRDLGHPDSGVRGRNRPVEALEKVEDSAFIPLSSCKVSGGASVLQLQAACGFRAFAEKRLWSTSPAALATGMDAAERGNIVHVALEHLWNGLGTQAMLRDQAPAQRTAALSRAIDDSLRKFQAALPSRWDAAYLDIQRERLHRLLSAWIEVELARPPFEVELREQEYIDAAIGPLLLSLRVDRIDRAFNEQGEAFGEVILDYKTGPAGPSDWQGERPDQPQLPLYATLRAPGTVAGIAFASLRPGKDMGLRGLAAREGVLAKPAKPAFETLDEQIAEWRVILTNLAIAFADGDARVRPKSYPSTCEFCQQRILCRLDPATLEDVPEELEEIDA